MIPTHFRSRKTDGLIVLAVLVALWGPGLVLPTGTTPLPLNIGPRESQAEFQDSSPCAAPDQESDSERSFPRLATVVVTITGYGSVEAQTDDTPHITAANTRTREGVIALSQDLLREFTPGAPFAFHDVVEIPGVGRFSVEDTMHPRWTHRADIWFPTREEAISWGRQSRRIYRLPRKLGVMLPLPPADDMAAGIGKSNFQ